MKFALAALVALSACTPAVAGEYQAGYSSTQTCYRSEYREEYVPGTENDPGYVKAWKETIEYPCSRTNVVSTSSNTTRTRVYDEYHVDNNDCSDGKVAGALLGVLVILVLVHGYSIVSFHAFTYPGLFSVPGIYSSLYSER